MAKVFKGRVMIPGDRMEEYFSELKAAEIAREPFRKLLEQLNNDFAEYLCKKYVLKTVQKHKSIVDFFIDFICRYTDVEKVEDITKGMVNSSFRQWYKKKVWDSVTENDLRVALRKFFQFLDTEKGICHQKVLDALNES